MVVKEENYKREQEKERICLRLIEYRNEKKKEAVCFKRERYTSLTGDTGEKFLWVKALSNNNCYSCQKQQDMQTHRYTEKSVINKP